MVDDYLNGKYGKLDGYKASLLYAVDRLDGSFPINKALDQGKVVVLDRYTPANAGHQGGKILSRVDRLKYFKWLVDLEYGTIGLPQPDLTFILHVPAKVAQKLIDQKDQSAKHRAYAQGKKRDIHEADLKHLEHAEKAYLEIAKIFPATKLIECTKHGKLLSISEIHDLIWQEVKKII
jgi:dTMP kinase